MWRFLSDWRKSPDSFWRIYSVYYWLIFPDPNNYLPLEERTFASLIDMLDHSRVKCDRESDVRQCDSGL